jgi:hypothetical protein
MSAVLPTVDRPAAPLAPTRRSLLLPLLGLFVGLALAGWSVFSTRAAQGSAVPAHAVALVNQKLILASDFRTQVEVLHGVPFDQATPSQKAEVLQSMVDEELLVQRGLEARLPDSDPDVRAALVGAVENQIGLPLRAREPSEQELRAYYEAHRAGFTSAADASRVLDYDTARQRVSLEFKRAALAKARADYLVFLRSRAEVQLR